MMRSTVQMLGFAALLAAVPAAAAPPADLDARVERAMRAHPQYQPPALALTIVEDGKVTWAKGYGVKRAGQKAAVDANTIFPIGSCGKAFTAATLALLVDDGKLSWDDKVTDKLPGFRLHDPYATAHLTVRDLLVHRSGLGLGAGDLLFMSDSTITRPELVHQLRYIEPKHGFREKYAYDNVLYAVAGQLVEAVSGQSWEAFVEKRIFGTLGMKNSVVDSVHAYKTRNHAVLHARLDGPMRGLGTLTALPTDPKRQEPRAVAPAGSIWSSAADMGRWLQVQLGRGALPDGKRLFSAAQSKEMWTPVVLEGDTYAAFPMLDARKPNLSAYALGWSVEDYRGHKVIQHAGFVLGGKAVVVLLPGKNVGISMMVNSEDGAPRWSLVYQLLDHYLDLPEQDWDTRYRETVDFIVKHGLEALQKLPGQQAAGGPASGPSLPLEKYAGVYRDPWYGTITISPSGQALRIQFQRAPSMRGTLEHVRHDTFRTRFDDRNIEDTYVTFSLKPDGGIDQVKMKAVSPLADFSFNYHDLLFTPVKAPAPAAE
jgi:CubicO group peptidase (beta-lactamase class C family)